MSASPLRSPSGVTGGSPVGADGPGGGPDPDATLLATPTRTPVRDAASASAPAAPPAAVVAQPFLPLTAIVQMLFGLVAGVVLAALGSVGPALRRLLVSAGEGLGSAVAAFVGPLAAAGALLAATGGAYYLYARAGRREGAERTASPNDVDAAAPRTAPAARAGTPTAGLLAAPRAGSPEWLARAASMGRPSPSAAGAGAPESLRFAGGAGAGRLTVTGGVAPLAIATTSALTLGRDGKPLGLEDMRAALAQMQAVPPASVVNPALPAARLVEACLAFPAFMREITNTGAGGLPLSELEAVKADSTRVVEWTTALLRCYQLALQAASMGSSDTASAAVVTALEALANVCGDNMSKSMAADGHDLKVAVAGVDALATSLGAAVSQQLCLGSRAFNAVAGRLTFEGRTAWLAELDVQCATVGLPRSANRKVPTDVSMAVVVRTVFAMVAAHAEAARLVARSSAAAAPATAAHAARARSVVAAAAMASAAPESASEDDESQPPASPPASLVHALLSAAAAAAAYVPAAAAAVASAVCAQGDLCHKYLMGGCTSKSHGDAPAGVPATAAARAAVAALPCPVSERTCTNACNSSGIACPFLGGRVEPEERPRPRAPTPARGMPLAAVETLPRAGGGHGRGGGGAGRGGAALGAAGRGGAAVGRVARAALLLGLAAAPAQAAAMPPAVAALPPDESPPYAGGSAGGGGGALLSRALLLAAFSANASTQATRFTLRGAAPGCCSLAGLVDSGSEADILSAAGLARVRADAPSAVRDITDQALLRAYSNVTLAGVGAAPSKPLAFVEVRVAAGVALAAPAAWHVVAVVPSLPGNYDMIISARRLSPAFTHAFNQSAVAAAALGTPSPMEKLVTLTAAPTTGPRGPPVLAGAAPVTTAVDFDASGHFYYFPGGVDGEPIFWDTALTGGTHSGYWWGTSSRSMDNSIIVGLTPGSTAPATGTYSNNDDNPLAFSVSAAFLSGGGVFDPTDPASKERYFVIGENEETLTELFEDEILNPSQYPGTWRESLTMGDVYNNLTTPEKYEFDSMLNRHANVFSVPRAGEMSNTTPIILTRRAGTEHVTAHGHTRPVRADLQAALRAEVDAYVAAGILIPVPFSNRTSFVSNVVVAWRANGKIRMCLDCVALNKVLEPATYPLPRLDASIASFGAKGNRVWSTCDMKFGFHQLPVAPESRHLLRVAIPGFANHFEYACLPFGVASAPQTFQRAADAAFAAPLARGDCVLYLDDIGHGAADWRTQMRQIDATLTAAAAANVHLNAAKCVFLSSSVTFLGWNFTASGRAPTDARRQGLRDMVSPGQTLSAPKARLQLQSAGALFNWCRDFVPNFAVHMSPLYNLSRKGVVWDWTPACEAAFQHVKHAIANANCLAPLDFSYPLVIRSDASDFGYGGVLLTGPPDALKPAAFCSRRFSECQARSWSTILKEAKAIHFCVNNWRHEVGASHFYAASDHKNLTWANVSNSDPQVARWARDLQRFSYTRVYIPGAENGLADAMSRLLPQWPAGARSPGVVEAASPTVITAAGLAADVTPREGSAAYVYTMQTYSPAEAAAHWHALGLQADIYPDGVGETLPFFSLAAVTRGATRSTGAPQQPADGVVTANASDDVNTSKSPRRVTVNTDVSVIPYPSDGVVTLDSSGGGKTLISATASEAAQPANAIRRQTGGTRAPARSTTPPASYAFLAEEAPLPENPPAVTVSPVDGLSPDLVAAVAQAQAQLLASASAIAAGVSNSSDAVDVGAAAEFAAVSSAASAVLYPRAGHAPLLHVVGDDGVARLYVPCNSLGLTIRRQLVGTAHGEAHFHSARNVLRLRDAHVVWPRLPTDCAEYAAACLACQRFKGPHNIDDSVGSAMLLPPPAAFGARVHVDLIGPLPLSRMSSNSYVLVCVDVFSRFVTLTPMPDAAAATTFSAFDSGWVGLFGLPEGVTSDGGSHFKGDFFEALGRLGVAHHTTTPYHPQSNGVVERVIRVVCEALKTKCDGSTDQWELHVPSVQLSINLALNRSIGVAPADVVFTFTPRSLLDASVARRAVHTVGDETPQGTALKARVAAQTTFDRAVKRHLSAQATAAAAFDASHSPKSYPVGSLVFVHYTPSTGSNKFHSNWRGPWRVVEVDPAGGNNYYSVLDPQFDRPHRVHVSRLREARHAANLDSEALFWATVRPDTSLVDAVLDHAGKGARLVFKVKWRGWDPIYATWQRAEALAKVAVVVAYAARHRIKL